MFSCCWEQEEPTIAMATIAAAEIEGEDRLVAGRLAIIGSLSPGGSGRREGRPRALTRESG